MQSSPIYQEIYASQLGNGMALDEALSGGVTHELPNRPTRLRSPRRPNPPGAWPGRCTGKIEKASDPRRALLRLLPYLLPLQDVLIVVFVFVLVTIYTLLGLAGPYLMGRGH